jgi:aldehyde:ferredoxin oxidoreductase
MTGVPIDSNVGGFFGPYLKFGGWDAMEIQGKADGEIIVFIDSNAGTVQFLRPPDSLQRDTHLMAEELTQAFARNQNELQSVSVVSAGRGADHGMMGVLNFSLYDKRRGGIRVKQAGRGRNRNCSEGQEDHCRCLPFHGCEARPEQRCRSGRGPADRAQAASRDSCERRPQCKMRKQGTAHLMEIMNAYDLLPTKNHKYGQDPQIDSIASWVWEKLFSQNLPDGAGTAAPWRAPTRWTTSSSSPDPTRNQGVR